MKPYLVLRARRIHFAWTRLPREIANAPQQPRWRMRAGVHQNDNDEGLAA